MFATGDILVRESKDILVVPATSLREDDSGDFVLKLDGGRLVRQSVKVKSRWNGGADIEIGDGVGIGDIVVTSPLPELKPGMAAIVSPRVG
jgi:multidrug efflux pump subunit AcrA (membrane-fusion protein)